MENYDYDIIENDIIELSENPIYIDEIKEVIVDGFNLTFVIYGLFIGLIIAIVFIKSVFKHD